MFGVPIGPFFVMNIVKPRINLAAVQSLSALGPFYAPASSLTKCSTEDDSRDLSETAAPLTAEAHRDIADRLKGAVFLAVREELAENIANPEATDLGARKAFAFARGLVEMMSDIAESEVERLVAQVQCFSALIS